MWTCGLQQNIMTSFDVFSRPNLVGKRLWWLLLLFLLYYNLGMYWITVSLLGTFETMTYDFHNYAHTKGKVISFYQGPILNATA